MRVLGLTHVFPRAEEDPQAPFLLTWAQALSAAGASVGVIAPHDRGLPGAHVVGGIGVRRPRYAPEAQERLAYRGEMHQIAATPLGPPLVASLIGVLARAVRRQVAVAAPDVLHVHWWVPGAISARLARVDVPTVCTVHGTDVALIESRPRAAALARWALGSVDRIEAVSSDLADRLERATGRRADAVNPMPLAPEWLAAGPGMADRREAADLGSGPDLGAGPDPGAGTDRRKVPDRELAAGPPPDGVLRVLAVGRMVPEKGFEDLLDAAATLGSGVEVTILGDGPLRNALQARADALGVSLALPGRVPPVALRAAYAQADVVVQASHREGLGLVAAEAACAGIPIIATDSGGVRDVLGSDGLLGIGDVAGLADALRAVAADPAAARARSVEVADAVRARLSPTAAAERTLAGYRALGVT